MNLTLKPQPGSANLSGADSSRQERLTSVQSFLFEEPNLPDLPNVTSSPELEDGPLPSSSPTGPKIARSGPAPALASPLAIPAAGSAPPTNATFGPSSPVSLRSASLQMFLASRLRARLAAFGSPEYELTWKEWAMPLGGPICALRASAHRTSGNGFTGWQSPVASEARQGFQDRTRGKKGTQISLTTQAVLNAPSPTSGGGGRIYGWFTPTSRDWKDSPGMKTEATNPDGSCRNRIDQLPRQAQLASGPLPGSSNAQTARRGVLNPAHSRWLMGFPVGWDSCGATAMQSCRSSRRNLSKH